MCKSRWGGEILEIELQYEKREGEGEKNTSKKDIEGEKKENGGKKVRSEIEDGPSLSLLHGIFF